jgi:hypothetical protein
MIVPPSFFPPWFRVAPELRRVVRGESPSYAHTALSLSRSSAVENKIQRIHHFGKRLRCFHYRRLNLFVDHEMPLGPNFPCSWSAINLGSVRLLHFPDHKALSLYGHPLISHTRPSNPTCGCRHPPLRRDPPPRWCPPSPHRPPASLRTPVQGKGPGR